VGTFNGIQIGATGLGAQRRGVETAGQNISNVNTDGYTRQRVDITADSGPITPAFHSTWPASGLGVRSVEVSRLRDAYIDQRVRDSAATGADLDTRAAAFRSIERVFAEPSDTGLSSVLADFLAAWDDLANQPGDAGARTQVIERGVTLANDIGEVASALDALREANRTELVATVQQVNAAAAQVAMLQETIMSARAGGTNANELLDQRDLLLERITTAIGGTVHHEPDGTATVFLGSMALVRGATATTLQVTEVAGRDTVVWSTGPEAATGGKVAGLQFVVNDLLPEYQGIVAGFGDTVLAQVNLVHEAGFDQQGQPGIPFFVGAGSEIRVNPDLLGRPDRVAASGVGDPLDPTPNLDGSRALELAGLRDIDLAYREMIVGLGVRSQAAQRRSHVQADVINRVRSEQEAANGVNLDEELSDLVRFQRAYEASARFISVVDELLDTLINRTGR
jgi:flagellar hook-associated protein 1